NQLAASTAVAAVPCFRALAAVKPPAGSHTEVHKTRAKLKNVASSIIRALGSMVLCAGYLLGARYWVFFWRWEPSVPGCSLWQISQLPSRRLTISLLKKPRMYTITLVTLILAPSRL